MLLNALFDHTPALLGDFSPAEKVINQYFNKRQFAHTDDSNVWNPATTKNRLFHRMTQPEADPYKTPVAPERMCGRDNVRPKTVPVYATGDTMKGAFFKDPVRTCKDPPVPRPQCARPKTVGASPSRERSNLPTMPMYTSKPKELFMEFPYYADGMLQDLVKHGVERKPKSLWCAKVQGRSRSDFVIGARDPAGPLVPTDDTKVYCDVKVKEKPLSVTERRVLAKELECKDVSGWRAGIPQPKTTDVPVESRKYRRWQQTQMNAWQRASERPASAPTGTCTKGWRGPRVGGPWRQTHNYHSYPVKSVVNGCRDR